MLEGMWSVCQQIEAGDLREVSDWCKPLSDDPTQCGKSYFREGFARVWLCEFVAESQDKDGHVVAAHCSANMRGEPYRCSPAQRIDATPPVTIAMAVLTVLLLAVLAAAVYIRRRRMCKRDQQLEVQWARMMTTNRSDVDF